MDKSQQAVEAVRLAECSSEAAYNWLKEEAQRRSRFESNEPVLEYILLRRKDTYIDLGLAEYATTAHIVRRVFKRGKSGVRCAALQNSTLPTYAGREFGWLDKAEVEQLVAEEGRELEAFAANPYLDDESYRDMMLLQGYFKGLSDSARCRILEVLANNLRFNRPAEPHDLLLDDPFLRAFERQFRTIPWDVALKIPKSRRAAAALNRLISKVAPPDIKIEDVDAILDRWTPENSEEDAYACAYFDLRTTVADAKPVSDDLMNSKDSALRASFYSRFDPEKYPNWEETPVQESDWIVISRLIDNELLWRNSDERSRLFSVCCRFAKDNNDDMVMRLFKEKEDALLAANPKWFALELENEVSKFQHDVLRGQTLLIQELKGIRNTIGHIEDMREGKTFPQRTNAIYVTGIYKDVRKIEKDLRHLSEKSEALTRKIEPLITDKRKTIESMANGILAIRDKLGYSEPDDTFGFRLHTGFVVVIAGFIIPFLYYFDLIFEPFIGEISIRTLLSAVIGVALWLGGASLMLASVALGITLLVNGPVRRLSYLTFNIISFYVAFSLAWPESFDLRSTFGLKQVAEFVSVYVFSLSGLYALVALLVVIGLIIWRGINFSSD